MALPLPVEVFEFMFIHRSPQTLMDCRVNLSSDLPYATSMRVEHGHWTLVVVISGTCQIEQERCTPGEKRLLPPVETSAEWFGPGDMALVLRERVFDLVPTSSRQMGHSNTTTGDTGEGRHRLCAAWSPDSETEFLLAEFPRIHPVLAQLGRRLPERFVVSLNSDLGERCDGLRQILISHSGRDEPGCGYVRAHLARLILWEILKTQLERAIPHVQAWDRLLADAEVANACLAMLDELDEHWTMTRLSRETQVPRCTLKRRFRFAVGCSPAEWLRSVRLTLAAQWLKSCDASVESIARLAGYQSSSGFRAAYQRATGVSPFQFRK